MSELEIQKNTPKEKVNQSFLSKLSKKAKKLVKVTKNHVFTVLLGGSILTAVSCAKDDLMPNIMTPPIMAPENNLVGSEVIKNFWQYTDILPADRGNFIVAIQEPNGNVSPRFEADGNGNVVTKQSIMKL